VNPATASTLAIATVVRVISMGILSLRAADVPGRWHAI
jgi:hypothetical protein